MKGLWDQPVINHIIYGANHETSFLPVIGRCFFLLPSLPQAKSSEFDRYASQYKSALLMDAQTGKLIYADRINEKRDPASLAKMMVALLVIEQVKQGHARWNEPVVISRTAHNSGGRMIGLRPKEVFPLEDLMRAMIVTSANDAAAAIAEHIGGSEANFVRWMNNRARLLGMKNTVYQNPHGLPSRSRRGAVNMTTAYDLSILARELLKYPKYLTWSSMRVATLRDGKVLMPNTNRKLMAILPEVDGLKTGFTNRAGFNLVATAEREGVRLISVVLGGLSVGTRVQASAYLLRKGFETYAYASVVEKESFSQNTLILKQGVSHPVESKATNAPQILSKKSKFSQIHASHFPLQPDHSPVKNRWFKQEALSSSEERTLKNSFARIIS